MDDLKICSKCIILQLIENFSENKTKKDGLNSFCKNCMIENNEENYLKIMIQYFT